MRIPRIAAATLLPLATLAVAAPSAMAASSPTSTVYYTHATPYRSTQAACQTDRAAMEKAAPILFGIQMGLNDTCNNIPGYGWHAIGNYYSTAPKFSGDLTNLGAQKHTVDSGLGTVSNAKAHATWIEQQIVARGGLIWGVQTGIDSTTKQAYYEVEYFAPAPLFAGD